MKTIGLIGGTTWISTIDYYRIINAEVNKHLGGLSSAKILLYSLNFEEVNPNVNEWDTITNVFTGIAKRLENAGADCIVLCANTAHVIADTVQQHLQIPLIHIAEETAVEVKKQNLKKVGLLGTRFTMEKSFYKDRFLKYNIEVIIPSESDRAFIHYSIFNELAKEIFTETTKQKYFEIITALAEEGAEGVIFGCTEIPILIKAADCSIPVFDTTIIHAKAAVEFACKDVIVA